MDKPAQNTPKVYFLFIRSLAVIFFDVEKLDTSTFPLLMKRAGHDISKKRFMSAQLEAYLQDNLWLTLAGQANSLAQNLAGGIEDLHTAYPQVATYMYVQQQQKSSKSLL